MNTCKCSKCECDLPDTEFPPKGNQCRGCLRAVRKAYYSKNKEREIARQQAYNKANQDKVLAYNLEYQKRNRDKINAQARERRRLKKEASDAE